MGYYKPHLLLFNTIINKFGTTPQNIIHIGDKLETDIKGVQDCGFHTIWFNEFNHPKSDKIHPDYEIS